MPVQDLIQVLLDEADLVDELMALVAEQRESVKTADHATMQELMKRVQDVSIQIQTQEAQRERLAASVATELGCEPNLTSLKRALSERDRSLLDSAGQRLGHAVFALKAEMIILNSLVEQNERYSAMLLSEWRRLDAGFMRSGGLDFRG